MMVGVILIFLQSIKVNRSESFVLHISIDGEAGLLCEAPAVIYVGMVFQPGSAMVPVIDGENAGSVPLQDLPFAPKPVLGEVAEPPDVGTALKAAIASGVLRALYAAIPRRN